VFTRDIKGYVIIEQPGLIEGGAERVSRSSWEKDESEKAVGVEECIPFDGTVDHTIFLRGTSTPPRSAQEPRWHEATFFMIPTIMLTILLFDAPLDVPGGMGRTSQSNAKRLEAEETEGC